MLLLLLLFLIIIISSSKVITKHTHTHVHVADTLQTTENRYILQRMIGQIKEVCLNVIIIIINSSSDIPLFLLAAVLPLSLPNVSFSNN